MKFKDFQAPALFSSTFKALNLGEKNSSTFKDFQGCVRTLNKYTGKTDKLTFTTLVDGVGCWRLVLGV